MFEMCAWRDAEWIKYRKHRKANKLSWDSSIATELTKKGGQSQYNPHEFGDDEAIAALERECIEHGVVIREKDGRYRKCYKIIEGRIVGACSGFQTSIAFAEWTKGTGIHGRPVSPQYLNKTWGINL